MPAAVNIPPDTITSEDLIHVYTRFCQAYGIELKTGGFPFPSDIEEFIYQGVPQWKEGHHIDYRPYSGAKFFASEDLGGVRFHGYSRRDDPDDRAKDEKFEELVQEYFSRRLQ